ncbi:OmpA family protein [Mucilaginibacter litoreus]|uniref:OmpA family protein n=1 Tax=Mucilaginibacter litoreus TaxID=1048221 RepID=A0ABW3ASV5_9SPHI
MKTNLKKASLLLTGIMVGSKLFAQTPDTTVNSNNYAQPFSGGGSFRTWTIGVHGGLLTPYTIFGPNNRQDFRRAHSEIGYGAYIQKQFLPGFALQADFLRGQVSGENGQPMGGEEGASSFNTKLNWSAALKANFTLANINWFNSKSSIQPYLSAGAGYMGYKTSVVDADGATTTSNGNINEWFIPVGLGFKFNLGSGVNLDLGYQVNFVQADNFDGVNVGSTNDRFSYAHIGLEFALGSSKKPQLATYNPVNSMRTEYLWKNQQTQQILQAQIDAEKAKNAQLRSDLDATNANVAKLTVDSDGDGVIDANDKCPNTPSGTKVDGSGCPLAKPVVVVTEEDRRVVKDAINNLEFDFGKATIRERSYASLQRVARLLVDRNFSLKLAGHTDNVGSDAANLKLSKDRAESIKSYLVSQGANPSRIEATGYGESQPIATNKTAAGRQQNRRVEFTLY